MECVHDWASWGAGWESREKNRLAHKIGERLEQCNSCGEYRAVKMSIVERELCHCGYCSNYTFNETSSVDYSPNLSLIQTKDWSGVKEALAFIALFVGMGLAVRWAATNFDPAAFGLVLAAMAAHVLLRR